ncbi:histidine phosphatase family protein [Massilia sp. YIM B02769]|uniref:histidine phosphatase family protein n=1 Tax=unclassified Massilia TaxID=2609279 RepID=UPI0025B67460|nr:MULTISPECIES: histidine phosphatase family protein [unclassified Massilia]MDN4056842.1 histidine phosphatase family protein [Massilia sp. YIM B02769]
MFRRMFLCLLTLLPLACAAQATATADDALWQRLRAGGVIVLMRHAATTPGVGDPPGFELGKCATQRNLSAAGRDDARAIGAAFRHHNIVPGAVWSSRWCRCLETARLAFDGAKPEPTLDSMFQLDEATGAARLQDLRNRLEARRGMGPLVLVTHDVNIRALTGEYLEQGEMLLTELRDGRLAVIGRLNAHSGRPATPARAR